jgi:hypothetical protein
MEKQLKLQMRIEQYAQMLAKGYWSSSKISNMHRCLQRVNKCSQAGLSMGRTEGMLQTSNGEHEEELPWRGVCQNHVACS